MMKKFKFSLQALLEIRERLEEEQKNKLAKAAGEYQQALERQAAPLQKYQIAKQEATSLIQNNQVSVSQLKYLDTLYQQAQIFSFSMESEIEDKRKKMDKEKEEYNKLYRDKKALEILKEKELKDYKKLIAHQENINMDEISKNQFFKTQKK
ncbi:MAG: flagellar export protein FliJ [Brevinema sp.]